jgi:hypothetical protein
LPERARFGSSLTRETRFKRKESQPVFEKYLIGQRLG